MSEYFSNEFVNSVHQSLKDSNVRLPDEVLTLPRAVAIRLRDDLTIISYDVYRNVETLDAAVKRGLVVLDQLHVSLSNPYDFIKQIIEFSLAIQYKRDELEAAIEESRTRLRN